MFELNWKTLKSASQNSDVLVCTVWYASPMHQDPDSLPMSMQWIGRFGKIMDPRWDKRWNRNPLHFISKTRQLLRLRKMDRWIITSDNYDLNVNFNWTFSFPRVHFTHQIKTVGILLPNPTTLNSSLNPPVIIIILNEHITLDITIKKLFFCRTNPNNNTRSVNFRLRVIKS